jgi:hypothetical protein
VRSSDAHRKIADNGLIEGSFLSNGPLYSLLAIYMPLSTLLALLLLAKILIAEKFPLTSIIINAGISAVIASVYCDFMKDVKSSRIAANIRGGIIIAGIFYALASAFRRELPLEWRFLPDFANIAPAIGAIYAWYSVISLKYLFSARRHFEIYTELYTGDQLQRVLLEDSSLLHYTDEIITKRKLNYVAQLVLIGMLTLINVLMKVHLPLYLYLLLIVILSGGICICGFFEIMRWEQYYAGEGIAISAADRLKRIGGMWALILLCTACAVLAASNTSLLPISAVVSFFAWLLFMISRLFHPYTGTVEPEFSETMETPSIPGIQYENEPGWFFKWMSEYGVIILKYIMVALAIFAFVMFMISPLLNRGKPSDEKLKFHIRLWRIIAEWFKKLLAAIVYLFALLINDKNHRRLKKQDPKEIRRTAESILSAYSQAKRQDIRRSVTLFARLIIWGAEVCQVTWKPSYAPGEYCGILAGCAKGAPEDALNSALDSGSFLKHLNEGIIRCGKLFEQALYSAEVLSSAEQQEFKNTVEEITGTAL